MQNWNSAEIEFLKSKLGLSTADLYLEFCDEFGSNYRSYHSVQKKIKKLRDAFSDEPTDTEEEDNIFDKPNLPLQQIDKNQKLLWKEEAQAWLEQLVINNHRTTPNVKPAVTEGTALVLVLSDLHFGKETPEFNLKVGKERLLSIVNHLSSSDLPENLDEIIIALGGDVVEGEDIFANQNSKIECSALEQMKACVDAIWCLILKLVDTFNLPVRIETAPGNHGRVSKTAHEKSNWDNVVYHILGLCGQIYDDPRIITNINFNKFKVFKVKDKTILLTHKGVKHTGTPAMREKIAGWNNKRNFDAVIHGHWHEWHIGSWLGKLVVANGCLCGPDDFSEEIAKEDDARQAYFFVTPDKPIWGFSYVEWK